MALTQNDIYQLEQAVLSMATANRSVEAEFSDGSRVRYAGLNEVQKALADARATFARQHRPRLPITQIQTSKGLN